MDVRIPQNTALNTTKTFSLEEVNVIIKLFEEITQEINLDVILQKSADRIVKLLNLHGSLIFLRESDGEHIFTKTISESNQSKIALKLLNLGNMKNSLKVKLTQTDNYVVDSFVNNRINSSSELWHFTEGVLSKQLVGFIQKTTQTGDCISIPLMSGTSTLGCIMFTRKEFNVGFNDILPILVLYSYQVANAIRIAASFDKSFQESLELKNKVNQLTNQLQQLQKDGLTSVSMNKVEDKDEKIKDFQKQEVLKRLDSLRMNLEKGIKNPFNVGASFDVNDLNQIYSDTVSLQEIVYEFLGYKFAFQTIENMMIDENILSIVQEVYLNYKQMAVTKGLNFDIKFTADLANVKVKANRKDILEAIGTVVKNALDYTYNGGVVITLGKNNDFVELSVKDTGIGVPLQEQINLFKPNPNISNSVNFIGKRSGLGLYNTKKIMNKHGAGIVFESKPNEGTTVFMLFPISK